MDALTLVDTAYAMTSADRPDELSRHFLTTLCNACALSNAACFVLNDSGEVLIPLLVARKDGLSATLSEQDMGESSNPLVYALIQGKPYQVERAANLVDVGQGFELLRNQLPIREALLVLPLQSEQGRALGVLLLTGSAKKLSTWMDDPVWQVLARMHAHLFASLQQKKYVAESVRYERSVQQARETERGRKRTAQVLAADFVGCSKTTQVIRDDLLTLAESSLSTLITGETGTGKDHSAWLIHQASSRTGKFVPVNCAAIPQDLIESELFGSTKGAFTGAVATRSGLVAEADGGTLFLDEIGDMPLSLQGTLLRVLNEKKYRPVGATREQSSDFRLICATHRPLPQLIRDGLFREDLYFRIRQLTLHLPPLRERREDIPALVNHILLQYNREFRARLTGLEPAAMDALQEHPFPGNIRELRSLILAAAERTGDGKLITLDALRPLTGETDTQQGSSGYDGLTDLLHTRNLPEAVEAFERLIIDLRLQQSNGSRSQAAHSLGMPKRTLARKCQKWNLDKEIQPT